MKKKIIIETLMGYAYICVTAGPVGTAATRIKSVESGIRPGLRLSVPHPARQPMYVYINTYWCLRTREFVYILETALLQWRFPGVLFISSSFDCHSPGFYNPGQFFAFLEKFASYIKEGRASRSLLIKPFIFTQRLSWAWFLKVIQNAAFI